MERGEGGKPELKVFLMPARACIKEDILKGWNNENVKDKSIWSKDEMFSNFKKIASLLTIAFFAMLLLTACGGAQGKVNVTLGIFKIDMPSTIKAGQVTFHVTNEDTSDTHEFVIFKTDLAAGSLPLDSSGNVDETAQGLTHIDEIPVMAPGDVKDLTVTLQPGKYVAICNLPGHYQAGMYAGFTVQ
jgi:uncharacterized cupredoxin-like copper-binding protein